MRFKVKWTSKENYLYQVDFETIIKAAEKANELIGAGYELVDSYQKKPNTIFVLDSAFGKAATFKVNPVAKPKKKKIVKKKTPAKKTVAPVTPATVGGNINPVTGAGDGTK